MAQFIDHLFPEDISFGSTGGAEFMTDVIQTTTGFEQRNQKRARARMRFNVGYGIRTQKQLEHVRNLHYIARGRAASFRFCDPLDHQAQNTLIGISDGKTKTYPLLKQYTAGEATYERRIYKPRRDTLMLYINGKQQEEGPKSYTLSDEGIIIFKKAPKKGHPITADFTFDVPVRFDTDYLPVRLDNEGVLSVALDIQLIETFL